MMKMLIFRSHNQEEKHECEWELARWLAVVASEGGKTFFNAILRENFQRFSIIRK